MCLTIGLAAFLLCGCGGHHYTSHHFSLVDEVTGSPVVGAQVDVRYGVVPCGGPFAFLGGPNYPKSAPATTDEYGRATMRLALDWPWGMTISAEATDYQRLEFVTEEETSGEHLPQRIELKPDKS